MSTPALDAGRVRVALALADGRVGAVDIATQRPNVAGALRGKPADQAVKLLPLIFALCGRAQGHAAELALAAARGVDAAARLEAAIAAEVMREHLWRLLLDLPPLLGMPAQRELFLTAQHAVAARDRGGLQAVSAQGFWNELWRRLDALDQPAANAAMLLPSQSAEQSLTAWPHLSAEIAAAPCWRGEPAETGAFARDGGRNPDHAGAFAARWRARAAEVHAWAAGAEKVGAGGTASAIANGPGVGRALVETARGLLLHEITLDGDRIADYVIVAPTEWNFHPRGRLHDWLLGLPAGDEAALRATVGHAVAALDPCVRWELEVGETL